MKCDSAREYFSDLIEKSLEPGKQIALEAHLAACPTCHAEFSGLQAMWADFELPSVDPPADLMRSIRVALREKEETRLAQRSVLGRVRELLTPRIPARASYAMAAAAVLLVALPAVLRVAAPDQFSSFMTSVFGVPARPVLTGVSALEVTPVANEADPSRWDIVISGVEKPTYVRVRVAEVNPVAAGEENALDVRLNSIEGFRVVAGRQVMNGSTRIEGLPLPDTSDRAVNVVVVDLTSGDSRRVAVFLPTEPRLPDLQVHSGQPQSYITGLWRIANDYQTSVVAEVYLRKQVRATSESVVGLAEIKPQAEVVLNADGDRAALETMGQAANLDVRERGGVFYLTRKPR